MSAKPSSGWVHDLIRLAGKSPLAIALHANHNPTTGTSQVIPISAPSPPGSRLKKAAEPWFNSP
jgi:hypothetical protein